MADLVVEYPHFAGGLSALLPANLNPRTTVLRMENGVLDVEGVVRRRRGLVTVGVASGGPTTSRGTMLQRYGDAPRQLFPGSPASAHRANQQLLALQYNYLSLETGVSQLDATLFGPPVSRSRFPSPNRGGRVVAGANANECYVGGVERIVRINAAPGALTFTEITPAGATGKTYGDLEVYRNRLYACAGLELAASKLRDYNSWTIGGTADAVYGTVGNPATEPLTAIRVLGGSLLLYSRTSIARWTGTDDEDFNLSVGTEGVSSTAGAISARCVAAIPNAHFVIGPQGASIVTEGGVRDITAPVRQYFEQTWLDATGGTADAWPGPQALHVPSRSEVWALLPPLPWVDFSAPWQILCYNYRTGVWSGPLLTRGQSIALLDEREVMTCDLYRFQLVDPTPPLVPDPRPLLSPTDNPEDLTVTLHEEDFRTQLPKVLTRVTVRASVPALATLRLRVTDDTGAVVQNMAVVQPATLAVAQPQAFEFKPEVTAERFRVSIAIEGSLDSTTAAALHGVRLEARRARSRRSVGRG